MTVDDRGYMTVVTYPNGVNGVNGVNGASRCV